MKPRILAAGTRFGEWTVREIPELAAVEIVSGGGRVLETVHRPKED